MLTADPELNVLHGRAEEAGAPTASLKPKRETVEDQVADLVEAMHAEQRTALAD